MFGSALKWSRIGARRQAGFHSIFSPKRVSVHERSNALKIKIIRKWLVPRVTR